MYAKNLSQVAIKEGSCAICDSNKNLQVHHLSYDPEIFMILCINCHRNLHKHKVGKPQWRTMTDLDDFREKHIKEIEEVKEAISRLKQYSIVESSVVYNNILLFIMSYRETMNLVYGIGSRSKTNYKDLERQLIEIHEVVVPLAEGR